MRGIWWVCEECRKACRDAELLTAPHPFEKGAKLVGCPNCKTVDHLVRCCDASNCKAPSAMGGVGRDGKYHHRCGDHPPASLRSIYGEPGSEDGEE